MKEIIEYILTAIIILSVIPFYNMVVSNYYVRTSQQVEEDVTILYADAIKYALQKAYENGNYSLSVNEINMLIDSWIKSYVGNTTSSQYSYYARIYSAITNISVDGANKKIIVKTLYNMSLQLALISSDGLSSISTRINFATSVNNTDNTYIYIVDYSGYIIRSFSAIIAILESSNVKFVGYWFNNTMNTGSIINMNNQLAIVNSRVINAADIPGMGKVANATLYYYSSNTVSNYSRKVFNITRWIVFSGNNPSCSNYNISEVNYLANYTNYNSSHVMYKLWMYRNDLVENKCSGFSEVQAGRYNYVYQIDFPVTNLLLVTLYDGKGNVAYAPAYWHSQEIGHGPPPLNARKTYFWIEIGIFTYMVELWVWRV